VVKPTKERNLFRFENNTKFRSEELPNNCAAANISLNYTGGTEARGTTGTTPSDKVIVYRPTIGMSEEHWPPLSICNTGKVTMSKYLTA
jgi:hypothetical protein